MQMIKDRYSSIDIACKHKVDRLTILDVIKKDIKEKGKNRK